MSPSGSVAETVKCVPVSPSSLLPNEPADVDQVGSLSTLIASANVPVKPEAAVILTA